MKGIPVRLTTIVEMVLPMLSGVTVCHAESHWHIVNVDEAIRATGIQQPNYRRQGVINELTRIGYEIKPGTLPELIYVKA